jgi:hypothetical protein
MPQITIYLDTDTARQMEVSARKAGLSKSRWIAEAVRGRSADEWPQSVRDLAGAWKDFPKVSEIRKAVGVGSQREPL